MAKRSIPGFENLKLSYEIFKGLIRLFNTCAPVNISKQGSAIELVIKRVVLIFICKSKNLTLVQKQYFKIAVDRYRMSLL